MTHDPTLTQNLMERICELSNLRSACRKQESKLDQPSLRNGKGELPEKKTERSASLDQEESPEDPWLDGFHSILRENISNEGLSFESSECLEEISRNNFKAEKPLSFDGMVSSCSSKLSLSEKDRNKLGEIFRKSISQAGSDVNLDEWYKCASNKKITSGTVCINQIYQDAVKEFFQEHIGNNLMKAYEFSQKWEAFASKVAEKVIKECEQDSNLLTEVYANECSVP